MINFTIKRLKRAKSFKGRNMSSREGDRSVLPIKELSLLSVVSYSPVYLV